MSKKTTKKKVPSAKKKPGAKSETKRASNKPPKAVVKKEPVKTNDTNGKVTSPKPPPDEKPNQSHYDLKNVTLEKDQRGVYIEYTLLPEKATTNSERLVKEECKEIPHPDFILAMGKLRYPLLRACGLLEIDRERETKFNQARIEYDKEELDAWATLKKRLDVMHNDMLNRTTISGLTISGKVDNPIFNIQGKFKTENGSVIALNSPQINCKLDVFGMEVELDQTYRKIFDEAWAYRFENKYAEAAELNEGLFSGTEDAPIDVVEPSIHE